MKPYIPLSVKNLQNKKIKVTFVTFLNFMIISMFFYGKGSVVKQGLFYFFFSPTMNVMGELFPP